MSVKVIGHARYSSYSSGSTNINVNVASTYAWAMEQIRFHLSTGSGGGGNFTVKVDSSAGALYDCVLIKQAMAGVQDVYYNPERAIELASGDKINCTWTNSSAMKYGLEVIYSKRG